MTEIVQACPLCGANEGTLFDQRDFRGIPIANLICQNCGLVYQSPRMGDSERQAFYEAGYRELYQGQETPKPEDLRVQAARADHVLEFIDNRIKPDSFILDIGCSAGILLKHYQDQLQAKVSGVEPGKLYREYARASGLEVYPTLGELQHASQRYFDLISLMHVLEHLPDPIGYLQELRNAFLAPGGLLLLEVPNLYAHDCFEVAHLISYSSHSLVQVLHKAGYELVKLKTHGLPRSRLIPLYITVLAHPASAASQLPLIRKEAGIKLKRKLGLFQRGFVERFIPRYAWQSH